jgi:hypothetical protein
MLVQGIDVYSWFASQIYGVGVTKKTHPRERQVGKVAVLSLQYGAGWKTFQTMLRVMTKGEVRIDDDEAKRVVTQYRRTFYAVTQTWSTLNACIASMATGQVPAGLVEAPFLNFGIDFIILPSNLRLLYPDLKKTREQDLA